MRALISLCLSTLDIRPFPTFHSQIFLYSHLFKPDIFNRKEVGLRVYRSFIQLDMLLPYSALLHIKETHPT